MPRNPLGISHFRRLLCPPQFHHPGDATDYGRDHYKTTDEVLQFIEYMKIKKPSTYGREIKNKLLQLGICNTVPSCQTISHVLRHELGYTRKRLSVVPEESLTDAAQEKQVHFLEEIADFP